MNRFHLHACRLVVMPGWALVAVAASASIRVSGLDSLPADGMIPGGGEIATTWYPIDIHR